MENFVKNKLEDWGLDVLHKTFEENCIDDKEAFDLLTTEVLKELIPKVGLRLKFISRLKSYRQENQPLTTQTSPTTQTGPTTQTNPTTPTRSTTSSITDISDTSEDESPDSPLLPPHKKPKSAHYVGTNLPAYLEAFQQRHENVQLSVLVLGTRQRPSQCFIIIDGLVIEANSLLKAVDICFKSFYVLDVHYPKECYTTWDFLQKFSFKVGEGKGKSVTSPAVRSLRTFIEKK